MILRPQNDERRSCTEQMSRLSGVADFEFGPLQDCKTFQVSLRGMSGEGLIFWSRYGLEVGTAN